MSSKDSTTIFPEYLLTMQQIADEFADDLYQVRLISKQDPGRLQGVRLYHKQPALLDQYVYIAYASDLPQIISPQRLGSIICIGEPPAYYMKNNFSLLLFPESTNILPLFEKIQALFEKNTQWAMKLQQVLAADEGLDSLFRLASEYFDNPTFSHDPHFFILSSPCYANGMTQWEEDPQTGMQRIPMSLINDFKVDPDYQETLRQKEISIFPADQRGYRILYCNLWNEYGVYEGRICINELQSALMPGQFHALEYFSRVFKIALYKQQQNETSPLNSIHSFLLRTIDGSADSSETSRWLSLKDWNESDSYLCIRMILQERDMQLRITTHICHHIEFSIPESCAFLHQGEVVTLINLSKGEISSSDCLSKLAIITREGLFKTGISNQYSGFSESRYYYLQAGIALNYGLKSDSMLWNYHFEQFALEYISDRLTEELPARQICSSRLLRLRQYDEENNTELYDTLKIYLNNERNTVQTANQLFIHRSTLFYRLNRIKTILDINLDIPENRLYLQLSCHLLEHCVQ